jgi:hypothetical protein
MQLGSGNSQLLHLADTPVSTPDSYSSLPDAPLLLGQSVPGLDMHQHCTPLGSNSSISLPQIGQLDTHYPAAGSSCLMHQISQPVKTGRPDPFIHYRPASSRVIGTQIGGSPVPGSIPPPFTLQPQPQWDRRTFTSSLIRPNIWSPPGSSRSSALPTQPFFAPYAHPSPVPSVSSPESGRDDTAGPVTEEINSHQSRAGRYDPVRDFGDQRPPGLMTSTKSTEPGDCPAEVGPNELQEAPVVHKSKVPMVPHVSLVHTLPHGRYVICHTSFFPVIFAARTISFSLLFVSIPC